jgi:drug/metabolite transporter (DMT)-like permease
LADTRPLPPVAAPQKTLAAALWGWALFITIETVTQIVFKFAGGALDDSAGLGPLIAHAAANPMVWLGFGLYFLGFLIWMTILKDVDLGRAFPMTAAIYLATLATAVVLFHEHLNLTRLAGVAVIIVGVIMLASDEDTAETRKSAPGESVR